MEIKERMLNTIDNFLYKKTVTESNVRIALLWFFAILIYILQDLNIKHLFWDYLFLIFISNYIISKIFKPNKAKDLKRGFVKNEYERRKRELSVKFLHLSYWYSINFLCFYEHNISLIFFVVNLIYCIFKNFHWYIKIKKYVYEILWNQEVKKSILKIENEVIYDKCCKAINLIKKGETYINFWNLNHRHWNIEMYHVKWSYRIAAKIQLQLNKLSLDMSKKILIVEKDLNNDAYNKFRTEGRIVVME